MNIPELLDHLHKKEVNIDPAVNGCLVVYAIAAIVVALLIPTFNH